MINRYQRYLVHQAHIMQLYVQRRQSEDQNLDLESLCQEWVQLFAADYRKRFGVYL